jgi:hypothetical protein
MYLTFRLAPGKGHTRLQAITGEIRSTTHILLLNYFCTLFLLHHFYEHLYNQPCETQLNSFIYSHIKMSSPDLSPPTTRAPIPPPRPAYLPTAGSPLTVDKDLYTRIQKTPRLPLESFILPIRSGRAWKCPAKSIVRISTPEGPQVGDLNIWNANSKS